MNAINGQVQSLTLRGQIARVDGLIDAVNAATREMSELRDELIAENQIEFTASSGRISSVNGAVEASPTSVWTEIEVGGVDSVRLWTVAYSGNVGYAWMDVAHGFISGVKTTRAEEIEIEVPSGAKYLRTSWNPETVTQNIVTRINVVAHVADKLDADVFEKAFAQSGDVSGITYRNDCYVSVSGTTATIAKTTSTGIRTAVAEIYPGAKYTVTARGANRFRIALSDELYSGKAIADCEYVYAGTDSTTARYYEYSFENTNKRTYVYVFVSNAGLDVDLSIHYEFNESGVAINNSARIAEIAEMLDQNDIRDIDILKRAYVPFTPFHYAGDVVPLAETARARNDANALDTMYGLFDELMAEYPYNVFMDEIPYNGRILDTWSESTTGEVGDVVMVRNGNDTYKQYVMMPDGTWKSMHTWADDAGTQIVDTVKMTCKIRVYTIVPFEGCDYESYLLLNGLHAMESGSDMGTYYSAKAMCEAIGTDTELGSIMATHRIIIVPVANPSQMLRMTKDKNYADSTHGISENGVNANRDYPIWWHEYRNEYDRTGNVALYDPYSRMLDDWMKSLTGVRYCISKHDAGAYGDRGDLGYVRDYYKVGYDITQKIIRQMGEATRATNQWIVDSFREDSGKTWKPYTRAMLRMQGNDTLSYGGVFDAYACQVLGVHTVLFESAPSTTSAVFNGGMHRAEMVKIIAEHIVNLLIGVNKNIANMEANDELFNTYYVWPEVE